MRWQQLIRGLLECFFVFSLNQTAEYATDDQTLIKKLSCCWWLNPTLILTTFTIRVVSFVSSSLTVSNEGSFRGKSNKFHLNPSKSKLSHCTGDNILQDFSRVEADIFVYKCLRQLIVLVPTRFTDFSIFENQSTSDLYYHYREPYVRVISVVERKN